ncbi:MAG: hypothetical protein M5R42_11035 [Rhodocyclaceae bacterium]|nr:hypothetical protein [Rhodocyclaceae bacterium]
MLMRRLDDGSNTQDGQPGNMYRHLGRKEARLENLKLFKKWIGEDAWTTKKTADITPGRAATHQSEELMRRGFRAPWWTVPGG